MWEYAFLMTQAALASINLLRFFDEKTGALILRIPPSDRAVPAGSGSIHPLGTFSDPGHRPQNLAVPHDRSRAGQSGGFIDGSGIAL